jgi:hypothetical protein
VNEELLLEITPIEQQNRIYPDGRTWYDLFDTMSEHWKEYPCLEYPFNSPLRHYDAFVQEYGEQECFKLRSKSGKRRLYYICHYCDNRYCERPQHFWLGTQVENIRDAIRKGRRPSQHNMDNDKMLNNNPSMGPKPLPFRDVTTTTFVEKMTQPENELRCMVAQHDALQRLEELAMPQAHDKNRDNFVTITDDQWQKSRERIKAIQVEVVRAIENDQAWHRHMADPRWG